MTIENNKLLLDERINAAAIDRSLFRAALPLEEAEAVIETINRYGLNLISPLKSGIFKQMEMIGQGVILTVARFDKNSAKQLSERMYKDVKDTSNEYDGSVCFAHWRDQ